MLISSGSSRIDIGHDHYIRFFGYHMWDRAGIIIEHYSPKNKLHENSVMFNLDQVRDDYPHRQLYELVEMEPLTIEPSIKCKCGDYGSIKDGQWEPL